MTNQHEGGQELDTLAALDPEHIAAVIEARV